ncbi:hypothetical protein [Mesorhizobium sp. M0306]|uniref:hypothetical protein n=1 Tax=unclassified Mesorhizobium TaxID=325217 RepID=UPI00333DE5EC
MAKRQGQREVADYLMSHGVVLPTPAPISTKLASADVEKGRTYFTRACDRCHNAEPLGGNKTDRTCGASSAAIRHPWQKCVTPTLCSAGKACGGKRT